MQARPLFLLKLMIFLSIYLRMSEKSCTFAPAKVKQHDYAKR